MKLGFMGAGNMAGALIRGAVENGVLPAGNVLSYDVDSAKTRSLALSHGILSMETGVEMISQSDVVVLAIKPGVAPEVLAKNRDSLSGKAVISIVAGLSTQKLRNALNPTTRILRVMPNTPALCGEGMSAFSRSHTLTDEEKAFAESLFSSLGRQVWVEERQMDAVTGLSGSAPAYAFLFIEALADGGVHCGLTREQALLMAAQTLKGSAEMVLTTDRHPGALKDMVTSPAGTTIAGVRTLERGAFRAAVMDAVIAGYEKSRQMSES